MPTALQVRTRKKIKFHEAGKAQTRNLHQQNTAAKLLASSLSTDDPLMPEQALKSSGVIKPHSKKTMAVLTSNQFRALFQLRFNPKMLSDKHQELLDDVDPKISLQALKLAYEVSGALDKVQPAAPLQSGEIEVTWAKDIPRS